MKKKSLLDTNPYLKGPEKYQAALIRSVASSTAIETGTSVESISKQLRNASDRIFQTTLAKTK